MVKATTAAAAAILLRVVRVMCSATSRKVLEKSV